MYLEFVISDVEFNKIQLISSRKIIGAVYVQDDFINNKDARWKVALLLICM